MWAYARALAPAARKRIPPPYMNSGPLDKRITGNIVLRPGVSRDIMHSTSRSLTLLISGLLSAAMGMYHFFLPRIYGWAADMRHTPPELRWALFSLNCFFSTLLLCAGLSAIASWWRPALGVSSSLTLAVFWCLNAGYQWLVPPPWPRKFVLTLLAFAVCAAVLSLFAVAVSPQRPRRMTAGVGAGPV
jgi:hypothetical protein